MAVRLGLPDYRSSVTSNFVKEGIAKTPTGRVDGRTALQSRTPTFALERDFSAGNAGFITSSSSAMVHLGDTKALAVVVGEVVVPYPDRPTEGQLHFSVEVSPMAEAGGTGKNTAAGNLAVEIARVIERGVRDSQALDTESLCIFAGERVWAIKVNVKVLDLCGNAMDAAALAAITALHHFRLPEIKADSCNGNIVVIPECDAQRIGSLYRSHIGGGMCYGRNGGVAISASELIDLANIASKRATVIYGAMTEALRVADAAYRKALDERLRSLQRGQDLTKGLFTGSPLKVDAGARGLAYLDYNDLFVTGQLKEEDPVEQNQKTLVNLQSMSLKEQSPQVPMPPPRTIASKEETLPPEQQRDVGKKEELLADDVALNMEKEEEREEGSLTLLKSEFPPSGAVHQVIPFSTAATSRLSSTAEPVMDDDDDDDLAAAVKKKKKTHGKRRLNIK